MGDGAHERRWGQAAVEVRKDGRWGKEVMQVGHGWRAETVEKNGELSYQQRWLGPRDDVRAVHMRGCSSNQKVREAQLGEVRRRRGVR